MDPITIAALMAMVAGAGMQYKATTDASKKAREQALANAQRQDEYSRQAEKKALDNAQEYSTDKRMEEQAGIEEGLTKEFVAPVESAQQIASQATTTQGDVSNDYKAAKAQSDLNLMKNARQLAGLMSKVTSANRLRNNEAIKMTDTAAGIDRLANFANREGQIGQYAVQQAGIPDAGMMLGGSVLQGLGSVGMAGGFGGAAQKVTGPGVTAASSTSANAAAPIATGTGTGFKTVGTTGLKIPKSLVWSPA